MSDERELPNSDAIQVMTMKVSKGLEFPVVALPGVGHMPAPGEDEKEAARVFYVAATRATQRLVVGVGGDGILGTRPRLHPALACAPHQVAPLRGTLGLC